jgi:hypothetical protein
VEKYFRAAHAESIGCGKTASGFLKGRFYRKFILRFLCFLLLFNDLLLAILFFVFLAFIAHRGSPFRFFRAGRVGCSCALPPAAPLASDQRSLRDLLGTGLDNASLIFSELMRRAFDIQIIRPPIQFPATVADPKI